MPNIKNESLFGEVMIIFRLNYHFEFCCKIITFSVNSAYKCVDLSLEYSNPSLNVVVITTKCNFISLLVKDINESH